MSAVLQWPAPVGQMKYCPGHKADAPLSQFKTDSRARDGLARYCNSCRVLKHSEEVFQYHQVAHRKLSDMLDEIGRLADEERELLESGRVTVALRMWIREPLEEEALDRLVIIRRRIDALWEDVRTKKAELLKQRLDALRWERNFQRGLVDLREPVTER